MKFNIRTHQQLNSKKRPGHFPAFAPSPAYQLLPPITCMVLDFRHRQTALPATKRIPSGQTSNKKSKYSFTIHHYSQIPNLASRKESVGSTPKSLFFLFRFYQFF